MQSIASEKLFAALCSQFYLKGFVFHSPKHDDRAGQQEVGDVVLWVRDLLIVFEIISRDTNATGSTKSFVKRIGEKRDQLVRDHLIYGDPRKQIRMTNESGEEILFDHQCYGEETVCGVVIVDSDSLLEKLHFETVRRSIDQEFPIAIMRKQDFLDLLVEVDTPADLFYYLNDRKAFLKEVFHENAQIFLDLNLRHERNLIGFYKLNDNSFPIDKWRASTTKEFWQQYQVFYAKRVIARNKENEDSFILDEIIDSLRGNNSPQTLTLLHSWELAVLPRRMRAAVAPKVLDGFEQMTGGRKERQFAFYNPSTACWLLFYFHYGGDREAFTDRAKQMTRMKIQIERVQSDFKYSVFCFAFRKSSLITKNTFDECVLWIEDAEDHPSVSLEEYQIAKRYFTGSVEGRTVKVQEFPG